jgi:hypothetical protein
MRAVIISTLCVGLGGCVSSSNTGNITPMPTVDIINKLRCELYQIREAMPAERSSAALVNAKIDSKLLKSGGLNPNLTFKQAVSGGTMSSILPFGVTGTTQKQYVQQFSINMGNLDKTVCGPGSGAEKVRGNLNVKRFFDEYLETERSFGGNMSKDTNLFVEPGKTFDTFTGTVEFTMFASISGGGVTWALADFVGPGGMLSVSAKSTNTLTMTFAVRNPSAPMKARAKTHRSGTAATIRSPVFTKQEERQIIQETTPELNSIMQIQSNQNR